MKPTPLLSSVLLTLSLAWSAPTVFAHVGHGDEFQAEGGINRVEVKAETDSLLGIEVTPIEPATDGSTTVLIPVTALVEDAGRQLVFVQYENFYEPVPVTTGATQGDLIEVTEGLSVGEQLVTQGSLSLYAESRKTQTAEAATSPETIVTPQNPAQADGNLAESSKPVAETQPSSRFPVVLLAGVGIVAVAGTGTIAVLSRRKKNS